MTDRDPGLAFERTTLAWHRTGLASAAVGAIALRFHGDDGPLGIALSGLLATIGGLAYAAGRTTPVGARRLLAMSVGLTAAAVLAAYLGIVG